MQFQKTLSYAILILIVISVTNIFAMGEPAVTDFMLSPASANNPMRSAISSPDGTGSLEVCNV